MHEGLAMRWIENAARDWWRLASVHFMWAMGALILWTTAYPSEWQELLSYIGQPWRSFLLFVVFIVTGPVLRLTSFKRGV